MAELNADVTDGTVVDIDDDQWTGRVGIDATLGSPVLPYSQYVLVYGRRSPRGRRQDVCIGACIAARGCFLGALLPLPSALAAFPLVLVLSPTHAPFAIPLRASTRWRICPPANLSPQRCPPPSPAHLSPGPSSPWPRGGPPVRAAVCLPSARCTALAPTPTLPSCPRLLHQCE